MGDCVACFLITVPEVDDQTVHRAARLKVESGTDTDVALITAEDLLWATEAWQAAGSGRTFDPRGLQHHPGSSTARRWSSG